MKFREICYKADNLKGINNATKGKKSVTHNKQDKEQGQIWKRAMPEIWNNTAKDRKKTIALEGSGNALKYGPKIIQNRKCNKRSGLFE